MPDDDVRRVLTTVAALAAELGPALAPRGFDDLLESIAEMARSTLSAATCSIVLIEGDELVFRVASGAGAQTLAGARVPIGQGIVGWVVASGQALGIDDAGQDPRVARDTPETADHLPRAIYVVPLDTGQEIVGVIEVLDPSDAVRATALEILEPFARQAALAVETGEAFDHLGQVLFQAAAAAVDDAGVAQALRDIAAEAPPAQAALADVAADMAALSRLGPQERAAASALLRAFLDYAQTREP